MIMAMTIMMTRWLRSDVGQATFRSPISSCVCVAVAPKRKIQFPRGKSMKKSLWFAVLVSALSFSVMAQSNRETLSPKAIQRITKEVRHELVMLPFYGVFDNLAYK